jgi:hypothetical protein
MQEALPSMRLQDQALPEHVLDELDQKHPSTPLHAMLEDCAKQLSEKPLQFEDW